MLSWAADPSAVTVTHNAQRTARGEWSVRVTNLVSATSRGRGRSSRLTSSEPFSSASRFSWDTNQLGELGVWYVQPVECSAIYQVVVTSGHSDSMQKLIERSFSTYGNCTGIHCLDGIQTH